MTFNPRRSSLRARIFSVGAACALAFPIAPAQALDFNSFDTVAMFFNSDFAANAPCEDVKTILDQLGMLKEGQTRPELESTITNKANDLIKQFTALNMQINLISAKTAGDISRRAETCGLVKSDPVEKILAAVGSSDVSKYRGVLSSLSSDPESNK